MPRFRAILFDLCDTLVHFDAERLPLVEIDNQPTRTTAQAIFAAIGPSPRVDFDGFFSCLKAVTSEIAARRDLDHREVTSQERFRRVLDRLGLAASPREATQNARVGAVHAPKLLTAPPASKLKIVSLRVVFSKALDCTMFPVSIRETD